jgi:hypothetical protein
VPKTAIFPTAIRENIVLHSPIDNAEPSTTRMCRLASSRGETYNDSVRIFLADASGVIGQRLIPRLVQAAHVVGGLTLVQQNGVTQPPRCRTDSSTGRHLSLCRRFVASNRTSC